MDRKVEHLIYTFFRAFDDRDWDALARCLTPTLFIDYSSFRDEAPGEISVADYIAKRKDALSSLLMQHNVSNVSVTLTSDGATVDCNYQILRFTDPKVTADERYLHSYGFYRFRVVGADDDVRISSITQTLLRNVGDPSIHSGAKGGASPALGVGVVTNSRRHPNVAHRDEVEPLVVARGKHRFQRRAFGPSTGSRQLGGSLMELAPGAASYPFHFHCANEEAIFIVSGNGTARIGTSRVPVRAGDWIAFPIGPEHAHQMINDGETALVYLVVGTDHKCEVIGYPDSKKIAAFGGETWEQPWVREFKRAGETLDYWDGEAET